MRKLLQISLVLVVIVIVLGSYTRLTDAGLGCPDWPGCYGFLTVPHSDYRVTKAEVRFPERPVEQFKAWNEMIHRYAAGTLGLFVFAITAVAIRRRMKTDNPAELKAQPYKLPVFLSVLIIFQALLGMWTVTMMLQPAIVMAHLLGGFTTFSLLALLYLRETRPAIPDEPLLKNMQGLAAVTLAVVIGQIALGGWVAANYAALACTSLPICEGNWWQNLDISGAFTIHEAEDYEFGVHSYSERMTMHVFHRIGAIITIGVMLLLIARLWQKTTSLWYRRMALALTLLLFVQVALGVTNVAASLPLGIAVAHNAVGALMMVALVVLNYGIYKNNKAGKEVSHG